MTVDDVADIRLIHPHSILVDPPYLDTGDDGRTLIQTPYADLLPKIFTTVLKTGPGCTYVRVGDVVMFEKHSVLDYYLSDHRRIWAMDERACQLVMEGWQ